MPEKINPQKKALPLFLISRIATTLAGQMITIAVGWQIYELTQSAFYLGLVGLIQFVPMVLMSLFAGYAADHFNRKILVCICDLCLSAWFLFLAFAAYSHYINTLLILIAAFIIGAVNSLNGPSMQSLLPNIVSAENFPRATAINASCFQAATIIGPAFGGILYSFGAYYVYLVCAFFAAFACLAILFVRVSSVVVNKKEPVTLKTLLAGFTFIKGHPIILGAISLDLFAVLFGGATALLPVYAATILNIGSQGLGLLRSAPAVGALVISLILSRKPITRKVGMSMFISVIIFGFSTIVFALSRNFYLSLVALIILGASDVVSVVIRSSLVQLNTPNEMRGRVSSVNQLFIGTSNQLGEFESGVTAAAFGTIPAALIGGVGTILVVLLWMKLFPSLRDANSFQT